MNFEALPVKRTKRPTIDLFCEQCGTKFFSPRNHAKYCVECRDYREDYRRYALSAKRRNTPVIKTYDEWLANHEDRRQD